MSDSQNANATASGSPDHFDRMLGQLDGLPGAVTSKQATIQTGSGIGAGAGSWGAWGGAWGVVPLVGHAETFVVQTIRWDEGETVFLQILSAVRSLRLVLPPKITAVIARQRDAASARLRSNIAKRTAAERKAAGLAPGFASNPGKGGRRKAKRRRMTVANTIKNRGLVALLLAALASTVAAGCGSSPLAPTSTTETTTALSLADAPVTPQAPPQAPQEPAPAPMPEPEPAPAPEPDETVIAQDRATVFAASMTTEHWYGGKARPFGRDFDIEVDGDRVTFGPFTMAVESIGGDLIARDNTRTLMLYVSLDRWTYNGIDGIAGGTMVSR